MELRDIETQKICIAENLYDSVFAENLYSSFFAENLKWFIIRRKCRLIHVDLFAINSVGKRCN